MALVVDVVIIVRVDLEHRSVVLLPFYLNAHTHTQKNTSSVKQVINDLTSADIKLTRICAAEMAVRYAALSACRKVHLCHCNSLGGVT